MGQGNKVKIPELGTKLVAILALRKDKRVFVRADKSVDYGVVMSVMATMRKHGIYKIGLITEPS